MSAASEICGYLSAHPEATKPQICRDLRIDMDTVTTAMRKLLTMGCVLDTGRSCCLGHGMPAKIFALGSVPFDQRAFTTLSGKRLGRPRKVEQTGTRYEFSGLQAVFGVIRHLHDDEMEAA